MLLEKLAAPAAAVCKPIAYLSCVCGINAEASMFFSRASWTPTRSPSLTSVRHATHAAQGRANGPKNGPGKRLGAKVSGDSLVIPGHIIFRQRGTKWHPGHNVGMGRDHTIYATARGYVKYYRDPLTHPKRRYIGVVFEKHETLPPQRAAPRRRRLGMFAVPRPAEELAPPAAVPVSGEETEGALSAKGMTKAQIREAKRKAAFGRLPLDQLKMSAPTYAYRESNWQIGRSAERAGIKVQPYVRGNRFLAWRKRVARRAKAVERRGLMGQKKKGGKGKK